MSRKAFRRPVTETSTTLSDIGELGDVRFEDGKHYRLFYTAASIADGNYFTLQTSASGAAGYAVVDAAIASTAPNIVMGKNETGGDLAAGSYFWGLQKGPITISSGELGAALGAANFFYLDSAEEYRPVVSTTVWEYPVLGYTSVSMATDGADTSAFVDLPNRCVGPLQT
jgi:hypothetical protein